MRPVVTGTVARLDAVNSMRRTTEARARGFKGLGHQ
jgi:hypothetical protein